MSMIVVTTCWHCRAPLELCACSQPMRDSFFDGPTFVLFGGVRVERPLPRVSQWADVRTATMVRALQWLSTVDFLKARLVCKRWRRASESTAFNIQWLLPLYGRSQIPYGVVYRGYARFACFFWRREYHRSCHRIKHDLCDVDKERLKVARIEGYLADHVGQPIRKKRRK